MKKWFRKVLFIVSPMMLISPIFLTSCGARGAFGQTIDGNEDIYSFINDRTFSIGIYGANIITPKIVRFYLVGTTWIFYHPNVNNNPYTYYALTNLHVASSIDYYINNPLPVGNIKYIGLSYQTLDDIKTNKLISTNDIGGKTSSSIMIMDTVNESVTPKTQKFQSLYSQYSTDSGQDSNNNRLYFDETVIKLDFSDNVTEDSALKERLDGLNTYASANNGYVTKFLPESNVGNVSTIYSMGYPLRDSNDESILIDNKYTHAYAFKLPEVVNNSKGSKTKFNVISGNTQNMLTPGGYGGNNYDIQTGHNVIYLAGTNLSNKNPIDKVAKWGGGSSGSCGIYVEDRTDYSKYYVSGIHWGSVREKDFLGNRLWYSCFQSFSYNWTGQNNFIDNFLSYQWQTQSPLDKFIGKCPFVC